MKGKLEWLIGVSLAYLLGPGAGNAALKPHDDLTDARGAAKGAAGEQLAQSTIEDLSEFLRLYSGAPTLDEAPPPPTRVRRVAPPPPPPPVKTKQQPTPFRQQFRHSDY